MRRVVVTGGTGRLGRVVVERLDAVGQQVRVVSRRPPVAGDAGPGRWAMADLRSGRGVDAAVADADVIVHCATGNRRGHEATLAGTVVDAARRAGAPHLLYVSIVGVDRVPLGFYRDKLAAERLIEASGVPHTILRATQFHDLVLSVLAAAARSPVMPVPALPVQPTDVRDVADRLVALALGDPLGRAPDVAGPEVREAVDLARAYLRVLGRRRLVLPVRLPGAVFGAYRQGGHLAPERAVAGIGFEEYLAEWAVHRGTSRA